jgi:hypothetical protein
MYVRPNANKFQTLKVVIQPTSYRVRVAHRRQGHRSHSHLWSDPTQVVRRCIVCEFLARDDHVADQHDL